MNVRELLGVLNRDRVIDRLVDRLPNQAKNRAGYEQAYDELLSISLPDPVPTDWLQTIEINSTVDVIGEPYVVVTMRDRDGTQYATDFVSWREVCAMTVDDAALAQYGPLDCAVHILYDVTFYGYSDRHVQSEREAIFNDIITGEEECQE